MVERPGDRSSDSIEPDDGNQPELDPKQLHEQLVEAIGVSEHWTDELISPSVWDANRWDDRYVATLRVLGRILYQLQKKKDGVEARIAWDEGWITGIDRDVAPMEYHSSTALADKIEHSIREVTAVFAESPEWRTISCDLKEARRLKDDLLADLYARHPPAKDTKKARIRSLVDAGLDLYADKRALAGLTETSKQYVNSIRNNRGGDAEPRDIDKTDVRIRDNDRCVKCGCSPEQEHFHHIIPPRAGGGRDPENIALLCVDCHLAAHGGHFGKSPIYDTTDEFWEWTRK